MEELSTVEEHVLQTSGDGWVSLDEHTQFLAAMPDESGLSFESSSALRRAQRELQSKAGQYANGQTYYDEYSQAWRLLGMYVDCSNQYNGNQHRDLKQNDDNYNANAGQVVGGCQRYFLWAAVSCVEIPSSHVVGDVFARHR